MELLYQIFLLITVESVLSIKCYQTNRECGLKKSIEDEASCKRKGYKEKICDPSYDSCVTTSVSYSTDVKIVNRYCGTEFEKKLCQGSKGVKTSQADIIREVKCVYCKKDLCNGKNSAAAKITIVGYLTLFLFLKIFGC